MKKILLIRLSSLGDVIFNIPLANVLKSNGFEVSWLVSEKGYDVVKNNPAVDKAILLPKQKWKKTGFTLKNCIEFFKIMHQLRKERYDIAIDTQMMFKSMIWLRFCGAKRRICYSAGAEYSHLGGNEKISSKPNPNYTTHAVLQHMRYAEYLNLKETDKIKFTLPPSSNETVSKINELLNNLDNSKPLVIISPATTWKLKHWNKDNWKTVIENIKDKCSLVFTGTENDKDLLSYIGADEHINLAGKTNLKDLAEIFSRATLVIAPDSGSAHLARATNKPAVISIFCCTPPTMYGPFGDDEKYFALDGKLKCQPCHKRKCPLTGDGFEQCVNYPKPEEIINIVNKVIQNSKHSV
ncbi:glycosyltransferase family 9 protein [bacterium]|nr:glycosyltransferase family 9 protein [bacterium]